MKMVKYFTIRLIMGIVIMEQVLRWRTGNYQIFQMKINKIFESFFFRIVLKNKRKISHFAFILIEYKSVLFRLYKQTEQT
jgi:hypothetical protein